MIEQNPNELSEKKILVVEDETQQRLRFKYVLESEGYRIDTAEDAESAISAIRSHRYDLVVTDLQMPGGKSGMDVLFFVRIA
jgi:CheY-like chemotaxis protein